MTDVVCVQSPLDQEVQQGKCEEVVLRARLSEKEKKGKWYIRNAATFKVQGTGYRVQGTGWGRIYGSKNEKKSVLFSSI